jgi:serine/threonine protein phosphatase PrpC
MVLADGVGSKPCDDKASATAVSSFLQHFGGNPNQTNLEARMQAAAQYANQEVHKTTTACQGMMTTFVAAVWRLGENLLYFTSVGDSRIYIQRANEWIQITEDDAVEKTEKVGSQTYTRSYITEALGAGVVHFDIQTQPFLPNDTCWLASDGFYHAVPYTTLVSLWRYTNFAYGTQQVFKQYMPHYQDDASVVALRQEETPTGFAEAFEQWENSQCFLPLPANLQLPALVRTIFEKTQHSLLQANTSKALQWLRLLNDLAVVSDLVWVEGLLEAFGKAQLNDGEIYQKIRALLAKSVQA